MASPEYPLRMGIDTGRNKGLNEPKTDHLLPAHAAQSKNQTELLTLASDKSQDEDLDKRLGSYVEAQTVKDEAQESARRAQFQPLADYVTDVTEQSKSQQ